MTTNAGVWIDHHKAVVVLVSGHGEVTKEILSNVDKTSANEGSSHRRKPEDMQERRFMNRLAVYYDEVIASLGHAESLLILGPGEAKGEFQSRLKDKKFSGRTVELETADKMTDRQIAANVRQHFSLAVSRRNES